MRSLRTCPPQWWTSSRVIVLMFLLATMIDSSVMAMTLPKPPLRGKLLVVGATGGTGERALQGLLDVGFRPQAIRLLTRNNTTKTKLRSLGFELYQVNLDNDSSDDDSLENAVDGCWGCYIHSTSSDTKKLDTGEEDRARNLASAIQKHNTKSNMLLKHIVYNSAAGEENHGVNRIQQKHNVEQVFQKDLDLTSLRANLFMEELWKSYTRPAILKGTYPFGVPSDRSIYLTSVRDMGRLAGACLLQPNKFANRTINVASDVLTPQEIADAFAKAQGSPCVHKDSKWFRWLSRLFFRDLYQIIRFYRRSTETTNITKLKQEFPNLLTSFEDFLEETQWKNQELLFENLTMSVE